MAATEPVLEKDPRATTPLAVIKGALAGALCGSLLIFGFARPSSATDLQGGIAQIAAALSGTVSTGPPLRVAVINFSDPRGDVSDLGRYVAMQLTTHLTQKGRFVLVEVPPALNFTESDLFSSEKLKELRRAVTLDAVVVGRVSDLGDRIDMTARVMEIETHRIIATSNVTITRDSLVVHLLGSGSGGSVSSSRPPAWLGVKVQDLTPSLRAGFDARNVKGGVLIASVAPGGPAAEAGLEAGDIVLGYNGNDVSEPSEFEQAVARGKPGQEAKLRIWRSGHNQMVRVTLAAASPSQQYQGVGATTPNFSLKLARVEAANDMITFHFLLVSRLNGTYVFWLSAPDDSNYNFIIDDKGKRYRLVEQSLSQPRTGAATRMPPGVPVEIAISFEPPDAGTTAVRMFLSMNWGEVALPPIPLPATGTTRAQPSRQ